jgi:hypothetical protein
MLLIKISFTSRELWICWDSITNTKITKIFRFVSKGQKILASESVSALETRGHYDFPSDGIKAWPPKHGAPFDGNADWTVSAFDQGTILLGNHTHEANSETHQKTGF